MSEAHLPFSAFSQIFSQLRGGVVGDFVVVTTPVVVEGAKDFVVVTTPVVVEGAEDDNRLVAVDEV